MDAGYPAGRPRPAPSALLLAAASRAMPITKAEQGSRRSSPLQPLLGCAPAPHGGVASRLRPLPSAALPLPLYPCSCRPRRCRRHLGLPVGWDAV